MSITAPIHLELALLHTCWVCVQAVQAVPRYGINHAYVRAIVCYTAFVQVNCYMLHFVQSLGSNATPPFAAMACAQDAVASQLLAKCAGPKDTLRCTRIAQPQKCVSRRAAAQSCKRRVLQCSAQAQTVSSDAVGATVLSEADTQGMSAWLDALKWDAGGLVAVIAQVRPLTATRYNV